MAAVIVCLWSFIAYGMWAWTPWISLVVVGFALRHLEGDEEADEEAA